MTNMNLERQQDELLAMESIYDSKVFTTNHNQNKPEGMFQAHVELQSDIHVVVHESGPYSAYFISTLQGPV